MVLALPRHLSAMKALHPTLAIIALSTALTATAQVVLNGTSYTQDFNAIGSGLPAGWSVSTSATLSTFGTPASFTSATTTWATTTLGSDFRNVSSNNIAYTTTGATQNANSDRALGWRPVGSNSGEVTPGRTGAVTLQLANTTGLQNFNLSVDLFTVNITGSSQTYQLEYRVGNTGDFFVLQTYITDSTANNSYSNQTTLTANSITLSALNDQSSPVFIRLRGTSTAGSTNLDLIGIDNFNLTYTAVPEPSTYALLAGVAVLAFVVARRRLRPSAVA
ncbi:MAG: hypothetical protein RLZZ129_963 [Verrucomicrobiota bacterium]|jgi:hypothetical protein